MTFFRMIRVVRGQLGSIRFPTLPSIAFIRVDPRNPWLTPAELLELGDRSSFRVFRLFSGSTSGPIGSEERLQADGLHQKSTVDCRSRRASFAMTRRR